MAIFKIPRRSFLRCAAGAVPFVVSPFSRSARGQSLASSDRPLRFITLFTPQAPFTYKERGQFPDDIWFNLFWSLIDDDRIKRHTRFFPQFSYNVFPRTMHDFGYVTALTGAQYPNIDDYDHNRMGNVDPSSVVDYPINSLDQQIARVLNQDFNPSFPILNQLALLMSEMAKNLTREGYFYTTNSERNFLDFVSFDERGRASVPWNNPSEILNQLFSATAGPDEPDPEPESRASAAVERILERLHGTEVAHYLSTNAISETETSYRNLQNYRARLQDLRTRTEQGKDQTTVVCNTPNLSPPGPLPVGVDGRSVSTVQVDLSLDFHFDALFHALRCDMTRVANLMFTNWEDACTGASYPGTSGPINVHNEGSHYEGSFGDPSNPNRRNIGHAYRYWYGKVCSFLKKLADQPDPVTADGSSMLDNSIVYIASQHGSHIEWGTHQMNNTAIAVVGGGRSLTSGATLLPALTSHDVMAHVFDGSDTYPAIRGGTVELSRPRRQIRNYNYDGGDHVTNLQLALLKLFDPSARSFGADIQARSRTHIDLSNPSAYRASHR